MTGKLTVSQTGARGLKPTEEQEAIIESVRAERASLMVDAGAGASKSTTLEMAAPGVRTPALALAFNRSIANGLKPRLPGNFTVKTLNGLGYGAWMRANPGVTKWDVDERKLGKIISQVVKENKVQLSGDQWDDLRQLVTKAMQAGITPDNEGNPLREDTRESWLEVAEDLLLNEEEFDFLAGLAYDVLRVDVQQARAGIVSFDDQVYCSACLGGRFPQFPTIFVDESQDLSPLNHHQLRQSLRPDARLVAVGDPRQAVYGFRGADHESMGSMRRLRGQWTDRRLTLTFRCPKAVVARQQEHYPGYRAAPGNDDGLVTKFQAPAGTVEDSWAGWDWADVVRLQESAGLHSIAILCRNNGPIFAMAFKLIRQGIGVVVLGRDIGKGLEKLSRKLAPEDGVPADIVRGLTQEWADGEISKALANGQEEKVAGISDRRDCLFAILDSAGVRNAGELRLAIEKLFSRDVGQVTLSSIHKAKGLEWDLVMMLDPWRIPSRYAKEAAKAGDYRQMKQELNLRYVAETRTRHTLVLANLEDFNG